MIVNIASSNPVKLKAVEKAFSHYFNGVEVVSVKTGFGVSHQLTSLEETVDGARNRALNTFGDCSFSVGLKAGLFPVSKTNLGYMNTPIAAVYDGRKFYSGGAPLVEWPDFVVKKILKDGKELEDVFDEFLKEKNVKQKKGSVGVFTKKVLSRAKATEYAVVLALCPIVDKKVYER